MKILYVYCIVDLLFLLSPFFLRSCSFTLSMSRESGNFVCLRNCILLVCVAFLFSLKASSCSGMFVSVVYFRKARSNVAISQKSQIYDLKLD